MTSLFAHLERKLGVMPGERQTYQNIAGVPGDVSLAAVAATGNHLDVLVNASRNNLMDPHQMSSVRNEDGMDQKNVDTTHRILQRAIVAIRFPLGSSNEPTSTIPIRLGK